MPPQGAVYCAGPGCCASAPASAQAQASPTVWDSRIFLPWSNLVGAAVLAHARAPVSASGPDAVQRGADGRRRLLVTPAASPGGHRPSAGGAGVRGSGAAPSRAYVAVSVLLGRDGSSASVLEIRAAWSASRLEEPRHRPHHAAGFRRRHARGDPSERQPLARPAGRARARRAARRGAAGESGARERAEGIPDELRPSPTAGRRDGAAADAGRRRERSAARGVGLAAGEGREGGGRPALLQPAPAAAPRHAGRVDRRPREPPRHRTATRHHRMRPPRTGELHACAHADMHDSMQKHAST